MEKLGLRGFSVLEEKFVEPVMKIYSIGNSFFSAFFKLNHAQQRTNYGFLNKTVTELVHSFMGSSLLTFLQTTIIPLLLVFLLFVRIFVLINLFVQCICSSFLYLGIFFTMFLSC
jgi:hypothetical protein